MFLREAEDRTSSEANKSIEPTVEKPQKKKSQSSPLSHNRYWSALLFSHSENDFFCLIAFLTESDLTSPQHIFSFLRVVWMIRTTWIVSKSFWKRLIEPNQLQGEQGLSEQWEVKQITCDFHISVQSRTALTF